MKKGLGIFLLVAIVGGIAFSIYWSSTECDRAYKGYSNYVSSVDDYRYTSNSLYRDTVNRELRSKQSDLASICLNKKPEISVSMYKVLIDSMNGPQYVLDQRMPRHSAQVRLVAAYYESLANAYERAGDSKERDKALKQSAKYEAEAARIK